MELLRRRNPDVVLLDINMPDVSGLDILRAKDLDSSLMHIPVIVLTASTDPDTKSKDVLPTYHAYAADGRDAADPEGVARMDGRRAGGCGRTTHRRGRGKHHALPAGRRLGPVPSPHRPQGRGACRRAGGRAARVRPAAPRAAGERLP